MNSDELIESFLKEFNAREDSKYFQMKHLLICIRNEGRIEMLTETTSKYYLQTKPTNNDQNP